ncbi:MAG: hypothetical protein KBD65_01525 [Candidatus Moranbacteria bacterium]|nr:hypothetical protein [Candidatus Moranbacteria bacterium]
MSSFEGIPNQPKEAERLFTEDQLDRENGLNKTDPALFAEREQTRYQKALEMFARYKESPQFFSSEDLYHLSFLFQHGATPEDYKRAHILALEAERQGLEDAKWLTAATEDRYLLSLGKKQKWGTQFILREDGSQHLAPIEDDAVSGITNEMRQSKNVPPRI